MDASIRTGYYLTQDVAGLKKQVLTKEGATENEANEAQRKKRQKRSLQPQAQRQKI